MFRKDFSVRHLIGGVVCCIIVVASMALASVTGPINVLINWLALIGYSLGMYGVITFFFDAGAIMKFFGMNEEYEETYYEDDYYDDNECYDEYEEDDDYYYEEDDEYYYDEEYGYNNKRCKIINIADYR